MATAVNELDILFLLRLTFGRFSFRPDVRFHFRPRGWYPVVATSPELEQAEAKSRFFNNFRTGGALGFGGSGLQQAVVVNGTPTVVQRSEGPGTISIFVERMMSDYFGLALEHTRGFSLGPFSMGSYFTGLAGRYYFSGPAPTVGSTNGENTILVVNRFTPFARLATGVASAEIKRDNDQVPSVSASGVYMGFRFGADYPLGPGIGIRQEIIYSTTFYQSPRRCLRRCLNLPFNAVSIFFS